jgi:hemoglobin-like flavoprotein
MLPNVEPLSPAQLERFRVSLERCLADGTFVSRFYARLMLGHAGIAARFAQTDMKKQGTVLKRSLYLVLRAALGIEDGLAHLDEVAATHGPQQLGIPAHFYDAWLDALIAVAHETAHPSESYADVERLWRGALQPCIDRIVDTQRA